MVSCDQADNPAARSDILIAAGALFVPVNASQRQELLARDYLQADETPVGVQSAAPPWLKPSGLSLGRRLAHVFLSGGVHADDVAVGDEERHHDLESGFQFCLLP